jgi:type II pantothenate kinase
MNFETDRIDDCVEFMKQLKAKQQKLNGSRPGALCVMATGGGAYKYYDKIREALGSDVLREDEMECLIIGTESLPFIIDVKILNAPNRSRFLHHRNPSRSFHI